MIAIAMIPSFVHAQKISVSRFELAENDLSAQNRKTQVLDQNGEKCALIRVQTTQKGFMFDVGSAGVQKIDEDHVGEIWVYVPYGVRHISIRHPELGALPNYDFPIGIRKARTYIMEITSDKVFVNRYDDTRKQKLKIRVVPADAMFTLNGMNVVLDEKGEAEQDLAFGTYTYKVESSRYFSKEGQVVIEDSVNTQQLVIDDLKPIMGQLSVHTDPGKAEVLVDGKAIPSNSSITPYSLQIGRHKLIVKCQGYKTEEKYVEITQDQTTNVNMKLSQVAVFSFTSSPMGALVSVGGERISTTPCSKELKTGSYEVAASKKGYKDYKKTMTLSSSEPNVKIVMSKIYNYKNEVYAEGNVRVGSFTAFGATIGGYFKNINAEVSYYFFGMGDSDNIYWSRDNSYPVSCTYSPSMGMSVKLGYGIPISTRFRLTPQVGANFTKLKENEDAHSFADGANVVSGLVSLRFSAAISKCFAVSLSPEVAFAMSKSDGYTELSAVSSTIKKWGEGFNVKLGLTVFF